jgi:5-methylcytosine-specific restriction protein A
VPYKPKKPCSYPNCPNLADGCYCDKHSSLNTNSRGNASERGYNSRWRKARDRFLKVNPLCVECLKENKLVPATVVDHIVPHRGDKNLFWDESNWQALCECHHNKKTRLQDQYQEYKF